MATQVNFDGATRVNDADTNTGWSNFNAGGATPSAEPQLRYQGSNAVNRKVTDTAGREGVEYDPGTGAVDMTAAANPLWFFKGYIADFGDLNTTFGCEAVIGSANNAFYSYNVAGSGAARDVFSTYPSQGGYLIVAINPSIAAWRDSTTGSPALTAVDYFAFGGQFQNGQAKNENLALDAIDIGRGLYIYDDGVSPTTQNFGDFLTADQDTIANRYGVVDGTDRSINSRGLLTIGDTAATDSVTFSDSTRVVNFVDGYHGPGDVGIRVLLNNASNTVTIANTLIGLGSSTTSDTRPDFTVDGTTGTCSITGTLSTFRNIVLTSAASVDGAILNYSDLTQGTAEIQNSTLRTNSASGVAAMDDATFGSTSGIHDSTFIQAGSGHAIEITTPGTYDFTNINFSGYGGTAGSNPTSSSGANDAAIYNNSGGSVTINVTGGNSPSVRNGTSATTTVVASADFFITNVVAGSEVRIFNDAISPSELAGVENAGVSPEGLSGVTVDDDPNNAGRKRIKYTYNQADAPFTARVVVQNVEYVYVTQNTTLTTAGASLQISQVEDRNYLEGSVP